MARRTNPLLASQHATALKRIRAEREAASRTVERILRDTPIESWPALSGHPDLQTWGAMTRIGRIFTDTLNRDPRHALDLAELGVSLAEAMPDAAYPVPIPAQIRAYAWKDLGKVFSALCRYQESVDALERAESLISNYLTLAYDRAIVRFTLAATYQEVGRYADAFKLLTECKEIFRLYEDTRLLVMSRIAEGVLLQRLRRYREARETYLLLLASTPDMEKDSRAALHLVIGFCSIELADFDDAESNLKQAIKMNQDLGQPIEVLKSQAGIGRLMIRRGRTDQGISHLRPVRRGFLQSSMPEEAGICALDIIVGMLQRGNASQAETLARMVVNEFTSAKLNTRAITALGYLTEALAAKKATTRLVTDVREYILSLRTRPEREFTPHA
ncbi:MAG TPA: tetratricopeptide repeat protein [Thermoanaerobaculia bacterium]|nr:tetratricopeptide repeat protein [Thermoanaerobaculia bacterium]